MKSAKKSRISLRVGDKIVDFGQVCRIFKIEKRKDSKGEKEKVICFRPYFKTPRSRKLSYCIPKKNLTRTSIRRPISKKKLVRLLEVLSVKPKTEANFNVAVAKKILNSNKPFKIAGFLKRLWLEKVGRPTALTGMKKEFFNQALKRLAGEVALVGRITPKEATQKIKKALEKMENKE